MLDGKQLKLTAKMNKNDVTQRWGRCIKMALFLEDFFKK
jgi:hypothetical protein